MSIETVKTQMHKFRVSPKPPELEAARLRENQRRHRARVKARTEELEAALAATQKKLEDALRSIDTLTAEVRQLRHAVERPNRDPPSPAPLPSPQSPSSFPHIDAQSHLDKSGTPTEASSSETCQGCDCGLCSPDKAPATTEAPQVQAATVTSADDITPLRPSLPSTRISHDGSSVVLSQVSGLEDGCALLPSPSPGESTMLCRDAYSIIAQRLSDVDFDAVTESLKPGFRRAIAPGSGCRVQTHILFSFVDRIT
ncbi:hypothetical protein QBC34DRAFT_398166 [Podospora aff. communis PSN243]|uniref:BZIP domain-containing protein n=1 Tax=Podospora aff. communis PSN243 TaxID=3040156 RepID=A0AAV9GYF5_9PEZI|nr:hypothetical protein QBC34DRAFT_398166 [Podospora aff. communis PSN243]